MTHTPLSTLGEFGLIENLTQNFKLRDKTSIKGVGDDAAVADFSGYQTLISTDLLVENIHFDLVYTPLQHLGYKAVAVAVSDIYAMNGQPTQILIGLSVSNRYSVEALQEIYVGINRACEYYGVDLVGGDTTSSIKGMTLSVTVLGIAKKEQIVYRSGAKVGDLVCVSGDFGAAYLGLQLLEREKQVFLGQPEMQPQLEGKNYLISRILKPEARKDIYEFLQKQEIIPTSMIDVSDGISSEINHICAASQVGALIEEGFLPISEEARLQAFDFKLDPTTCALHGGEDYELLFTINPKDADKLRFSNEISIIGEILPQSEGIRLQTKGGNFHNLTAQGFRHY
jgi:thiamine-monophosphate kinase